LWGESKILIPNSIKDNIGINKKKKVKLDILFILNIYKQIETNKITLPSRLYKIDESGLRATAFLTSK